MRSISIFLMLAVMAMAAAQDKAQQPALIVTGSAEAKVIPDHAIVRLGVVARGDLASPAQTRANEVMQKLIKALAVLKIEKEDIQTSNLSLQPVYDNQPRDIPKIVGYEARNTVSVRVPKLDLIGKVIDAGITAGANNVEGVFFGLGDDAQAKLAALRDAVTAARAKAKAMADAAGVELLGIQEIIEGGAMTIPPPMMEGRMMMAKDASTPIEPGQVTISATVTIRYLIRQKG
ncbi:MAG: SIMPL domain-containing protein [Fimbriimonadaceae bacterium]